MRFEDLVGEKQKEPEKRVVQDLKRTDKKVKGIKKYRSSSVKPSTFVLNVIFVRTVASLIAIGLIVWFVWWMISLYSG